MNAFDKQAQRARAQQLSAELAAQGLSAPTLTWPVPPPSNPAPAVQRGKIVMDTRGKEINIGDAVAYSRHKGAAIMAGTVIGFSQSKKSVLIRGKKYSGSGSDSSFYKPVPTILKIQ